MKKLENQTTSIVGSQLLSLLSVVGKQLLEGEDRRHKATSPRQKCRPTLRKVEVLPRLRPSRSLLLLRTSPRYASQPPKFPASSCYWQGRPHLPSCRRTPSHWLLYCEPPSQRSPILSSSTTLTLFVHSRPSSPSVRGMEYSCRLCV